MVLLLGLLNQKSIGPYNFRIIKVGATRTDTAYIETPASIFRVDMPKNDQSLEVDLTELVKGIPSVQLRNRENYAQDLQLSMRGFGHVPHLKFVEFFYIAMLFLPQCQIDKGKPQILI